jgi:hypothetical protein
MRNAPDQFFAGTTLRKNKSRSSIRVSRFAFLDSVSPLQMQNAGGVRVNSAVKTEPSEYFTPSNWMIWHTSADNLMQQVNLWADHFGAK